MRPTSSIRECIDPTPSDGVSMKTYLYSMLGLATLALAVTAGVWVVSELNLTPSVTGTDANTILQQNEMLRQ